MRGRAEPDRCCVNWRGLSRSSAKCWEVARLVEIASRKVDGMSANLQPSADAEGGDLPPDEAPVVSWFEQPPESYRRRRAWIAAGIAAAMAGWLAWEQLKHGVLGQKESFWLVVVLAVGAWRYRHWMNLPAQRRFATVLVQLTTLERLRKALPFLLFGFGPGSVILLSLLDSGHFKDDWGVLIPFVLSGLGGVFVVICLRREQRLTPEAVKLKAHYERLDKKGSEARSERIRAVLALPLIRYAAAAACFWFAYFLLQENASKNWAGAAAALVVGMALAHELFKWVLGAVVVAGLCWMLFAGIAALPLSAAIIIGALIIAGAVNR